jgi:hypothetical protein
VSLASVMSRADLLFPVADGSALYRPGPATDSFKCLFVSRMHNTRAHAEVSFAVAKARRALQTSV